MNLFLANWYFELKLCRSNNTKIIKLIIFRSNFVVYADVRLQYVVSVIDVVGLLALILLFRVITFSRLWL
jgi:hypothetical protein